MKRYLMFAGSVYYPSGGADDFRSDHDNEEEARQAAIDWTREDGAMSWAHVWDSETKTIVMRENR